MKVHTNMIKVREVCAEASRWTDPIKVKIQTSGEKVLLEGNTEDWKAYLRVHPPYDPIMDRMAFHDVFDRPDGSEKIVTLTLI